jgi:undecaprenyl diphosphate synthase
MRALTLYCLSSENWKRPAGELAFLMRMLEQFIVDERPTLAEQNIRVRAIGRRDRLSGLAREELERTIELCQNHTGLELVLAIDYGGRSEITEAARRLAAECQAGVRDPASIDEAVFGQYLQTHGLPDPDLLIRTGGDLRVSNFLLWQISYAEIWVTDVCWPDFDVELYCQAIRDFAARDRRFGGLNDFGS